MHLNSCNLRLNDVINSRMICILLCCSLLVFRSIVMARNGYKKISTSEDKETVSFISVLFFRWMNSVFTTGNKRSLDQNDFLPLSKENSASFLTEQLQANWNMEKTKCKRNGKKPKLWKSLIKMLSVKDAIIIAITGALHSVSCLLRPLFLGYLISTLMSAEPEKNHLQYGCALALCINSLIGCNSIHHHDYRCELLGIRFSCALKGLVYMKVSSNRIQKSQTTRVA